MKGSNEPAPTHEERDEPVVASRGPEGDVSYGKPSAMRRVVEGVVDFSIRRSVLVILIAIGILVAANQYTTRLELKSDFLELLPRDSPGFIAFEQQLERMGGGASLNVIADSPDRKANERFIDDLTKRLEELADSRKRCVQDACGAGVVESGLRGGKREGAACAKKCGPELISYVESGTKEVREFF